MHARRARVWQAVCLGLAATSCATLTEGRGSRTNRAQADGALELALQLPASGDECVVAQPARLLPAQAEVYGAISQADLWVWQKGAPVLAYARVAWTRGSQRRWLALLRFAGDRAAVQAWLQDHAGLDLQWEGADAVGCAPERCPVLAGFIDEHTLRLAHGAIPVAAPTRHVSPCAQLLRKHHAVIEVSYRHEQALFTEAAADVPLHMHAWTQATAESVGVEREELMADSAAAQRALEREPCRDLWGGGNAAVDAACERTRSDMLVVTRAHLRWDDLRMRREDDERHARAERYAAALERSRPDSAVNWSDLDDVLSELTVRRTLLDASAADPRPIAAELLERVEQALAQHPHEARLLQLKAELEPIAQVMTSGGRPAMTPP